MNKGLKKTLKIVLPIALGVFLVWYSYYITTPEDRAQIFRYIGEADLFWVGLSVIIGIASHVSRAIRWNYLLEPLGYKPSLTNNLMIILMAYFTNLGIPRSGEILRATALATYEDVPFEKGFGTIVTERVIDLIMLFIIILIALVAQTDTIIAFFEEQQISFTTSIIVLVLFVGLLVLGAAILRHSSWSLAQKLRSFIKGMLDGITSIFKMRRKWLFIAHTIFIWGAYVAMFWVIKYTVAETVSLSLDELLVAFIAGAFAMTATNGGLGLYPILVSKALSVFGISAVAGDAFGWIMWIAQTLMVVAFGAISFLVLPLWNRNR